MGWASKGNNLRRECKICGAISLFNLVDGIMLGELAPNQATRLEPGEAETIMKTNRYVDRFRC